MKEFKDGAWTTLGLLYKINNKPIGSIKDFTQHVTDSDAETFVFRYLYNYDGVVEEYFRTAVNKKKITQ
jgi:hypothetical protein